jgi:hypothetical protein
MKGTSMVKRLMPITAVLAVAVVATTGGIALAQSGSTTGHHHKAVHRKAATHPRRSHSATVVDPVATTPGSSVDGDSVQSGDQSAPDTPGAASQEQSGNEQSGNEQANDGPGGHEDEPGNPNVDHQFEGEE